MGHDLSYIGHNTENRQIQNKSKDVRTDDFVFEKGIFNNIFEKDIRRVFIYKKAEQLAKAAQLIAPAFSESMSLKNRIDTIAIGLIDAAGSTSRIVRTTLSRELLSFSSILSIARTSGLLSPMNVEIIIQEARNLLQEITTYEEPRLLLDDMPTLSGISKNLLKRDLPQNEISAVRKHSTHERTQSGKGHIKDRRETILSVIKNKQKASIKDISTLIRGVSEKTIQRELSALIEEGAISKQGERRWSTYSLAS